VVRRGHCIALVVAFLIGCAVVLMAGASGVQAQATKKEEGRCEGTRTIMHSLSTRVTNDIPGWPQGWPALGHRGIRPDPIKGTCPAKFVWWGRR
jgi:hypothetical protein